MPRMLPLDGVGAAAAAGAPPPPPPPPPLRPPVALADIVLRYCRNVRPTWVKFDSKDTKESGSVV